MKWMFMPLRRYADFNGRSRRMEFWMWQLMLFVVSSIMTLISFIIIGGAMFALLSSNPEAFETSGNYEYGGSSYASDGSAYSSSSAYGADLPPEAALQTIGVAGMVIALLFLLLGLFILIPNLAVAIRRLHDTNRTGWWVLAPAGAYVISAFVAILATAFSDFGLIAGIVALLGLLASLGLFVLLIVFYCLEGTRGPNRFGADPKGPSHEDTFR